MVSQQRSWSMHVNAPKKRELQDELDRTDLKRFLAYQGSHSGAWLHALPMSSIGLKLTHAQVKPLSLQDWDVKSV